MRLIVFKIRERLKVSVLFMKTEKWSLFYSGQCPRRNYVVWMVKSLNICGSHLLIFVFSVMSHCAPSLPESMTGNGNDYSLSHWPMRIKNHSTFLDEHFQAMVSDSTWPPTNSFEPSLVTKPLWNEIGCMLRFEERKGQYFRRQWASSYRRPKTTMDKIDILIKGNMNI